MAGRLATLQLAKICSLLFGREGKALFFFLSDPPPTEFSPLPLHDALPICPAAPRAPAARRRALPRPTMPRLPHVGRPRLPSMSRVALPHVSRPALPHIGRPAMPQVRLPGDRKSTRLNSSHSQISYAVFCLK